MKDLHTHLLYGVDDGSRSLEETIKILKSAEAQGITDILLTPHYMKETDYICNNTKKKELFENLKEEVRRNNININLYLGNELYLTDDSVDLMLKNEIATLNNSKYLLLEFPLNNMLQRTRDILYDLIKTGCVPIIAHPERYKIFQRHPEHMEKYISMGVLLQGNYMSLLGKYGKDAKKTLTYFLKQGWITFLASDVHRSDDFQLVKTRKVLKSIVKDDEYIEDMLVNNFDIVVNDGDIGIMR